MVATTETRASPLERPTLILNKNWTGIDACTVRDALSDVCSERARIVHPEMFTAHDIVSWMDFEVPEGEPYIKAVRGRIKVPEVIVLNEYNKIPHRKVVFSRRNLWKRDRMRCQYCGAAPRYDEITIDHVVPRAQGGISSWENCVLACISCNKRKDNKTPEQARMPLWHLIKGPDGKTKKVFYKRPTRPHWSPIYAVRRQKIPASWNAFLSQKIDEMYWDTELEP